MSFKSAYFIKLFLIVTVSAVLLASVETAPDRPFLFLAVSAAGVILIRSLWKSALRDEKTMDSRQTRPNRKGGTIGELPPDLRRAA